MRKPRRKPNHRAGRRLLFFPIDLEELDLRSRWRVARFRESGLRQHDWDLPSIPMFFSLPSGCILRGRLAFTANIPTAI